MFIYYSILQLSPKSRKKGGASSSLGEGKKSTMSGFTGSVTEGCSLAYRNIKTKMILVDCGQVVTG